MISGPSTAPGAPLVGVTKMRPRAVAGLVVSTVIGTGCVSGDGAAASPGTPPSGAASCADAPGLTATPNAAIDTYDDHRMAMCFSLVSLGGVPVRIGGVTVMPGDLVVGDREGVYFIPPQFVKEVLDRADEIHVHDEWTKKKFDEGKYKSSEIYGSPKDPKLQEEYREYLKRRLEQIRKQRGEQ